MIRAGDYDLPPWNPVTRAHFPVVLMTFRVDGVGNHAVKIVPETMVGAECPRCIYCEQHWTAELAQEPCQGPRSDEY
jgi:hypothetical protein